MASYSNRTVNSANTILVVEDEEDLRAMIEYNLRDEGYEVHTATDGIEGLEMIRTRSPDLIVLDIMMPRMDGITLCRQVKDDPARQRIPVVMLTARGGEAAQIEGLDAGADVYLNKPISMPVLKSQVRSLLRSAASTEGDAAVLRIDDLEIDRDRYEVRRKVGVDTRVLRLPRKEFELLFFLASRPGTVFSRARLLDDVWGPDVFVVDRTVDVHVRKIREKIGAECIETVKGVGYRFRG